jgi:acyl dehydratase
MTEPARQAEGTKTLSDDDFAAPIDDRYLEDYRPGAVYEYGHITVTEAEILEFARAFDRQPIHVKPAFAAEGPFRGLIASGWHTGAIMMRLFADRYLSRLASLASPGINELRWPAPLRPGDSVKLQVTIIEARSSRREDPHLLCESDSLGLQRASRGADQLHRDTPGQRGVRRLLG